MKSGIWSQDEKNFLIKLIAEGGYTNQQIANELSRTLDSTQTQKRTLGLTGEGAQAKAKQMRINPRVAPATAEPAQKTFATATVLAPAILAPQIFAQAGRVLQSDFNSLNNVDITYEQKTKDAPISVTVKGQLENVEATKTVLTELFESPKAGEVFNAQCVMTRDFGAFMKLKPFYAGVLPSSNYIPNEQPVTGQSYMVRVTDVQNDGRLALELVKETVTGVAPLKPNAFTVDELVDHLNGMSKVISAKLGQKVVLAAYVIAD
jgi:transposase-like protein